MRPASRGARALSRETVWIVLVVTAAGAVRGFTGFGAGLFMAPLLVAMVGPQRAVPLLVLLDGAVSAVLLPGVAGQISFRRLARLAVPAVVALPVGSIALTALPARWLQAGISVVVLATVLALASGWRLAGDPGPLGTSAAGAASGLLTGAAGIGGPPVILFQLSGPGSPPEIRASLIGFFTLTQAAALAVLALRGLLPLETLATAALLAVPFLSAAWLGARLFGGSAGRGYRGAAYLLLAASGLTGLISALR